MSRVGGRRVWHPRVTDALLVLLPAVVGLLAVRLRLNGAGPVPPPWLLDLDLTAGAVACLALWWRRRFPVPVAAGVVVLTTFAESASPAALVALFTVASTARRGPRRRWSRPACWRSGSTSCCARSPPASRRGAVLLVLCGHVAAVAWGLLVRSRRQLIASLRERAAAAEVEARLRAERAQHEARETLAREMHDVLGHRLSLLSVHAGALAFRRDASAEDVGRAAEVIRENAHRALQDLREVIGVLRAPVGELPLPGGRRHRRADRRDRAAPGPPSSCATSPA